VRAQQKMPSENEKVGGTRQARQPRVQQENQAGMALGLVNAPTALALQPAIGNRNVSRILPVQRATQGGGQAAVAEAETHDRPQRLSSSRSQRRNQAAIDAMPTGAGFSGIYHPGRDEFRAESSGDAPGATLPRRGGHAIINNESFRDSRNTVGFTAIKQADGSLNVTWLSRGVTGRNFRGSDGYASREQQRQIKDALAHATGRTITG
jgi:hypothetical protein